MLILLLQLVQILKRNVRISLFEFQISNSGGVDVGAITWLWNGCAKQAFTDSDSFGVTFPTAATLQQKALVLGATMLLVSINLNLLDLLKMKKSKSRCSIYDYIFQYCAHKIWTQQIIIQLNGTIY